MYVITRNVKVMLIINASIEVPASILNLNHHGEEKMEF
jgi:hypothetical protein